MYSQVTGIVHFVDYSNTLHFKLLTQVPSWLDECYGVISKHFDS